MPSVRLSMWDSPSDRQSRCSVWIWKSGSQQNGNTNSIPEALGGSNVARCIFDTNIRPLRASFFFSGIDDLLAVLSFRSILEFLLDFLSFRSGMTSLQQSIIFSNKKT